VPLTDTSPDAQAVQLRILRAMSGEDRFRLAIEMSSFARSLAESRIRLEHPEWAESKIVREWIRLAFLPEPLPPGLRD
jgi:hypothetical protein